MLEEFSKGKVLTVKTQRKVMRKKRKEENIDDDGDSDGEGGSENESSEEERCIERQFNFIGELTILVDYTVIEKYT